MSAPNGLDRVQRWMLSVISHPDGIQAGIECKEAQHHLAISPDQLESVIARSHQLMSPERLQIYANAYYSRLIECLREEFPTLVHVLGASTFDGFAFGYLHEFPPRSYTLADLGQGFPLYLEQTRPTEYATDDAGPGWPDFVIDVARLERTYSEVFDGPGSERQAILLADDLAAVAPDQWPNRRLKPVPCLRLLSLRYPVHEYVSAVRRGEEPPVPEPSPTYLAVTRRDYVVRRTALTATEFALLTALLGGRSIGEAIASIANEVEDCESLEKMLRMWFRNWSKPGFFQSIEQ